MSTPPDSTAQTRPPAPALDFPVPPTSVAVDRAKANVQEAAAVILSDGAQPRNVLTGNVPEACPVCEAERLGAHCIDCGHAFQDERLTLRPLIRRGITRVFDLDAGLLHTFLELFRRPGQVARDYAGGVRRPYVNPFTYFVLAAAVQIIGMRTMWDPMARALSESVPTLPDERNIYFHIFGESWAQEYIELTLSFMAQTYTWMALVFFAIPLAVALRLLMGKRLINLAEGIVFSLYTSGHMLLITATAVVIVAVTDSIWYHQMAVYPLMIVWTMYAIVSYFGRSVRTFVTGGIAMVLAFLCFFLANIIGMLVNMVLTVGVDRIAEAFQALAAQSQ